MLFLCCGFGVTAQVPESLSSTAIYQGLKKLNVLGSALYVAAHPDDENTRLLAYLSKEKLYRTGYLSLTRGDGGQNLIGEEQGIELGMIRTQELLAARRVDGAEQFFSRAYDFGYSKTADETLKIWGKEKILADIVWVIRKFQPDVIITRFPSDARAGHGHHWSSALLANEAFRISGDPNVFPEQLKLGVKPWQAKRILWNAFIPGGGAVPDSVFRQDVGAFNTLLGKGYGEIASESRSNHKSQGFGAARTRGQTFEYFITTGGDKPAIDLFDGVATGWQRENQAAIAQQVQQLIESYQFEKPAASVKGMIALYQSLQSLPEGYWKQQKLKELQGLIESAAGLFSDASAAVATAVRGDSLRIGFLLNKRNDVNAITRGIRMAGFDTSFNSPLPANRNFVINKTIVVDKTRALTQPYWIAHSLPNGSFDVRDQYLIGNAENSPAFEVEYLVEIEGQPFTIRRPVQYKYTDPVRGEVYQPVAVLPQTEVRMDRETYVSVNGAPVKATVNFKTNGQNQTAAYGLRPTHSAAWKSSTELVRADGTNNQASITLTPANKKQNSNEVFSLVPENNGSIAVSTRVVAYDHIPTITYFPAARAQLVNVDLKTGGKKIGYIVGAGDKVPEALAQIGYEVTILGKEDITAANLDKLDAVITGIRAYNVHSFLSDKHALLMDYIRKGGNLIVQYNTNNQIGPVRAKMGPYNFTISRNRVSEEQAAVSFALPDHPVLNTPNKITAADFEGWVQERSVYEADQADAAFVRPLAMADQNEKTNNGSLIIAPHGKGNFIYTGLSFFRQLPAGVPGAYRLLANLVATPRNK